MFSFAVIVWQVLRGKVPFSNMGKKTFIDQVSTVHIIMNGSLRVTPSQLSVSKICMAFRSYFPIFKYQTKLNILFNNPTR